MELNNIYNLLQKASNFEQYMLFNNLIFKLEDEKLLTNNRNGGKLESVESGHNKILNFIKRSSSNTTNNTK